MPKMPRKSAKKKANEKKTKYNTNEIYKSNKKQSSREHISLRRTDEKYAINELEKNNDRIKSKRNKDQHFKKNEQLLNKNRMQEKRESDLDYKNTENNQNRIHMKEKRESNLDYKNTENNQNRIHMKEKRDTDLDYKRNENIQNQKNMKRKREDENYSNTERFINNKRTKLYRENNDTTNKSKEDNETQLDLNLETLKNEYLKAISSSCEHICSSCGGLWFRDSVNYYTDPQLQRKQLNYTFIKQNSRVFDSQGRYCFCYTCKNSLFNHKVNFYLFYIILNYLKLLI